MNDSLLLFVAAGTSVRPMTPVGVGRFGIDAIMDERGEAGELAVAFRAPDPYGPQCKGFQKAR
ncbi:hypothetical protein J19TS2_58590 [Cohnella xylanilytica]|nr:hypothetical protein J19TS2_58590 [Cohnella xylanilytica]